MIFIYEIRNSINNKVYFGQTKTPLTRWSGHKSLSRQGKQHPLYDSMRKHGIDSFVFTVLSQHETQEQADIQEQQLIQSSNSYDRIYGYNLQLGGNRTKHSEATKKKLSEQKIAFYQKRLEETGSKITEDERKKLSDSHKGIPSPKKGKKSNAKHWNLGKKMSQEHKAKISASRKGKEPWNKGLLSGNKRMTKLSLEDRQEIRRLYESGMSSKEIAKIYYVSPTTIMKAIRWQD